MATLTRRGNRVEIRRLAAKRLAGVRGGADATREILALDRQPDSTNARKAVWHGDTDPLRPILQGQVPCLGCARMKTGARAQRRPCTDRKRSAPRRRSRRSELPELTLADHRHLVSLRCETADVDQLGAAVFPRDLQRVRPPANQDVGALPRLRLHDRAGTLRGGDRFASGSLEKAGERQPRPP